MSRSTRGKAGAAGRVARARWTADLGLLGLGLVLYHVLLRVLDETPARLGPWPRLVLPSAWLLAAALLWIRHRGLALLSLRGGDRAVLLCVLLVLATAGAAMLALVWPGTGQPWGLRNELEGALLVLLAAPAEELYFRGLMLDRLAGPLGRPAAVALVSGLFGLLHFQRTLLLPMFLLSAALCIVTLASGSVLWAPGLHASWNMLAIARQAPLQRRWTLLCCGLVACASVCAAGLLTRGRGASAGGGT